MSIGKKLTIGLVILIALYAVGRWGYGEISYAYFQHKCETEAGEFIYRTVNNVEGLYQMRPRDPRDYFDRLRHGDIPEDPYGHTNREAQRPHQMFVRKKFNDFVYYKFLETSMSPPNSILDKYDTPPVVTGEPYWIYTIVDIETDGKMKRTIYHAEQSSSIKSKYGFTWNEVRDKWDKFFGIYGSELIVKDLIDDETLGIRRGYFYLNNFSRRASICPRRKNSNSTYAFVSKVLMPIKSE